MMGNEGGNAYSMRLQSRCREEYCIQLHQPPSSAHEYNAFFVRVSIMSSITSVYVIIHFMDRTPADEFHLEQQSKQQFNRNHFNNVH